MRVTQSMITNQTMRQIQMSFSNLAKLQEQATTGKKFTRASQDPVAAVNGMRYRTEVRGIEQYERNISEAHSWMESSDSAMYTVTQTMHRIREVTVQAANDTYDVSQRENIAQEIGEMIEHIVDLANTSVNNKYIFNGTDTSTHPVDEEGIGVSPISLSEDGDYVLFYEGRVFSWENGSFVNEEQMIMVTDGELFLQDDGSEWPLSEKEVVIIDQTAVPRNNGEVNIEVMHGVEVPVNITAGSIFNAGFFADLKQLEYDLSNPDISAVQFSEKLGILDEHMNNLLTAEAQIGARANRIDMIHTRISEQNVIASQIMSENEDVDMVEVFIDLMNQENVHHAALSSGARMIQPSLIDFLR